MLWAFVLLNLKWAFKTRLPSITLDESVDPVANVLGAV
jgi:hypothetical protein